jgi:hypothetical protein
VAAAVWAQDLPCGVVDKRQNRREELLAIFAEKLIARHTNLLGEGVAGTILEPEGGEHNMVLARGRTIAGIGRSSFMPEPPHLALRILLRTFSLLAVVGACS